MRVLPLLLAAVLGCLSAYARPVCVGEMCYPSEQAALAAGVSREAIEKALREEHVEEEPVAVESAPKPSGSVRLGMGYMKPSEFLTFLRGKPSIADSLEQKALPVILLLILLGGLFANLTPCVLPLVPVNLVLVGRGWRRGAAYGLGIAIAYGMLGVAAAFGGMAFGTIQSSPWFSLLVAIVFTVLGLAMSEVFFIDFTKYRSRVTGGGNKIRGLGGVFLLGVGAAVLAGACVEPILLATLVLTAKWFAAGKVWAIGLPFVLGLGMGLPWPFAAAGLSVLPKPGAWMRWVNRVFAFVFFCMAAWYGWLAWTGFSTGNEVRVETVGVLTATPETWEKVFAEAKATGRPVFVDVWASWCKNCLAMEKTTFRDPEVVKELAKYTVIRLQAEDLAEFLKLKDFRDLGIKGIPAFIVFKGEP
ncbi:MAG: cytochrome c biogenesis protein CcdA [bacterium]|nr:cytochrome c biogenesis protein CcdA [bacterium]